MRKSLVFLGAAVAASSILMTGLATSPATALNNSQAPTEDDAAAKAMARAMKITAQFAKIPTSIGVTVPLKARPQAGFSLCAVSSGSSGGAALHRGAKEAAGVLGWNYREFTGATTPEKIQSTFRQALDSGCQGIYMNAIEPSVVGASLIKQSTDLGILVVDSQIVEPTPAPNWNTGLQSPATQILSGQAISSAVTVQSRGLANVQFMSVPLYPTFQAFNKAAIAQFKLVCPKCQLAENNFTSLTEIGTKMPPAMVSVVQRNPKTDWIVVPYGDFLVGVPQALAAAGITKMNYASNIAAVSNFTGIRQGQQTLGMAQALPIVGWRAVDNMSRMLQKMTTQNNAVPMQILTPKNIGAASFDEFGQFIGIPNYRAQFAKLWKIS